MPNLHGRIPCFDQSAIVTLPGGVVGRKFLCQHLLFYQCPQRRQVRYRPVPLSKIRRSVLSGILSSERTQIKLLNSTDRIGLSQFADEVPIEVTPRPVEALVESALISQKVKMMLSPLLKVRPQEVILSPDSEQGAG